MKTGLIVVFFHPDAETIKQSLAFTSLFERVYIFDNTEGNHCNQQLVSACSPEATYLHKNENLGTAGALNIAARQALKDGLDGVITMDQDSRWNETELINYLKCIASYPDLDKVAMLGINFENQALSSYDCQSKDTEYLITSGSWLNLNIYSRLPGFDEKLFIDEVDHDYCYQAILNGYRITRFDHIFLQHTIGFQKKIKNILSKTYTYRNLHQSIRMYYILRNYLYINKKYPASFLQNKKRRKSSLLVRIKNNLLYNPRRFQVLMYLLLACWDSVLGKMGKRSC